MGKLTTGRRTVTQTWQNNMSPTMQSGDIKILHKIWQLLRYSCRGNKTCSGGEDTWRCPWRRQSIHRIKRGYGQCYKRPDSQEKSRVLYDKTCLNTIDNQALNGASNSKIYNWSRLEKHRINFISENNATSLRGGSDMNLQNLRKI